MKGHLMTQENVGAISYIMVAKKDPGSIDSLILKRITRWGDGRFSFRQTSLTRVAAKQLISFYTASFEKEPFANQLSIK